MNVFRMEILGAKVIPVTRGTATLDQDQIIIINLSGRGDKVVEQIKEIL